MAHKQPPSSSSSHYHHATSFSPLNNEEDNSRSETTTTSSSSNHSHNLNSSSSSKQMMIMMNEVMHSGSGLHHNQPSHHSSLLGANSNSDTHLAGMSSDSELASRHHQHQRPYSTSRSRAYHAHPAPRSSPVSSGSTAPSASRMSHHSDSAATNYSPAASAAIYQQAQSQLHRSSNYPQLAHQGSLSSAQAQASASIQSPASTYLTSTVSASHGPADLPLSPLARPLGSGGGRQLPQRPTFKQSMSIDHHAMGQMSYNQPPALSHHHPPAAHSSMMGQPQPQHYASPDFHHQYQFQPPAQTHAQQRASGQQPASSRNFRLDMEQLDRRAAAVSLSDSQPSSAPHSAAHLPPTSAGRLLPAGPNHQPAAAASTGGSLGSVDRLLAGGSGEQPAALGGSGQYSRPTADKMGGQYGSHQQPQRVLSANSAAPVDWLPPMAANHHSGSYGQQRTGGQQQPQFKVAALSIDHYSPQVAAANQQQRASPHFVEHFRQSPLATSSYSSLAGAGQSAGYHESPYQQQTHHQIIDGSDSPLIMGAYHSYPAQSEQHSSAGYSPAAATSARLMSHQSAAAEQQQREQTKQRARQLQQQLSSSSSNNSQSGSHSLAMSSGHEANSAAAANKSMAPQQSDGSLKQQQQQSHRHGPLRKGYTSAASSSLGGSHSALNELSSEGTGNFSHGTGKRSVALRASSPPLASSESQYQQYPSSSRHYATPTSGSSYARDGSGSRSESSTGLPSGGAANSVNLQSGLAGSNNGQQSSSSLTKKSNSATQLSMTGTKKRLGFRKKQVTSFSVHRSEEVAPLESRHLVKQGSSVSEGESSLSGDSSSRSWSNSNFKQPNSDDLASMSFIDGLGKGQMISRQGLASPYLGDIQLSLCDRRGNLEIEVIRARNLQAKANKILPLTYVKLYLVKNRKCLAKAKTTLCNKRTLDPLFQQQLTFHEDYHGSILQSIVWGNFGKMDKKNFMGIAQISIDDLELNDTVISWYKLFLPSSLQTLPSKSLRHTLLSNSTESFTNTNNANNS